ncbi:MAG: 16S rRNA (uracil(1498)-N(3))-methyltransferase [Candidatus Latescibacteria bacterium]|nr:16S rRNA (uracil(1498)-N(3))-methyltransferase [Candidatus Latescibacterota bacterium]
MSCFYVQPQDVTKDRVILRGEEAHHCLRVRRHRKGDVIEAVDGAGMGYQVRSERVEAEELVGKIVGVRPEWGEPKTKITLAQSLIKGDGFDWIVEKATELGVHRIVPMRTGRTVLPTVRPGKIRRWEKIARSAMKQSKRCRQPVIEAVSPFEDTLELLRALDGILLAWEDERKHSLKDALSDLPSPKTIGLLIGPEGGFAADELELARCAGARFFSMGPRRLKAETAGILAVGLTLYELGDL